MAALQSQLNKLTVRNLTDFCSQNGLDLPKTVKLKKDIVEYIINFENWPSPLEELLDSFSSSQSPKKPSPSKSSKMQNIAVGVQSEEYDALKKVVEVMQKDLDSLKEAINLQKTKNSENRGQTFSIDSAAALWGLQSSILEAVPSGEDVFLDDFFDFLDNFEEDRVKSFLIYALQAGILIGKPGGGEIQLELPDGLVVGRIRRKN